jgi:lysophospholipase L1-like esterase
MPIVNDACKVRPPLRLLILGSSVTLILRPPRKQRGRYTYAELLEQQLWKKGYPTLVINEATRAGVVSEAIDGFHQKVTRHSPDVVVIHYGINEAVPRLLPRRTFLWLNTPRPRLAPLPTILLLQLNRLINGLVTPLAIKTLRLSAWYPPKRFTREMTLLLEMLAKETQSLTYIVNIAPTTPRIESYLPGAGEKIQDYNQLLADLARQRQVPLIDLYSYVVSDVPSNVADGIHLTAHGHRIVADLLLAYVERDVPQQHTSLLD